jgi:hypothetical protein
MSKEKSQSTFPIKLTPHQWLAWIATLLLSILPDILFRELTGGIPEWRFP